jgi:Tetratricopeptide repeat.
LKKDKTFKKTLLKKVELEEMMNNDFISAQLKICKNVDEQTEFLKDLGEWEKAMTTLNKATASANKTKASTQQQKFQDAKSSSSVNKTVAKAPSPVIYRNNRMFDGDESTTMNSSEKDRLKGNKLYSSGRYEESIQAYTKSLQLNPCSAVAYSNRGKLPRKNR